MAKGRIFPDAPKRPSGGKPPIKYNQRETVPATRGEVPKKVGYRRGNTGR